jgi:hypothetical protein
MYFIFFLYIKIDALHYSNFWGTLCQIIWTSCSTESSANFNKVSYSIQQQKKVQRQFSTTQAHKFRFIFGTEPTSWALDGWGGVFDNSARKYDFVTKFGWKLQKRCGTQFG